LNTIFIDALQRYGYLVLWPIIFIAAVGAPISGNLLLFASGAFVAFGDFNIFILFAVGCSAAVLGDNLGYYIGRRVGVPLFSWLERQKRFRFISPSSLEQSRAYFRRRTAWAIFLTRFLIVVLGGPINLLAGAEEYPYLHFLFWDISGQILGAIIPLTLGYIFAESWVEVAGIFGTFSSLVLAFLVVGILFVVIKRKVRQYKSAEVETHNESQQTEQSSSHEADPIPIAQLQSKDTLSDETSQ
jgi:membrane-associated protein